MKLGPGEFRIHWWFQDLRDLGLGDFGTFDLVISGPIFQWLYKCNTCTWILEILTLFMWFGTCMFQHTLMLHYSWFSHCSLDASACKVTSSDTYYIPDIALAAVLFSQGHGVWASVTVAIVAIPTFVMLLISFRWYAVDKTLTWKILVSHILFLAPVYR